MSGHCVLIKGLGPKTIDVHNCWRFAVLNKKYKRKREGWSTGDWREERKKERDKSKVKTVIKTLLTRQRKLVKKRGPPIEGRGITRTLALVIKSKRN